jgi:hypothetical protein
MFSTTPPQTDELARVWYKGHGFTVTVTTFRCVSVAKCQRLAGQGKPVALAQGRRVWLSRSKAGPLRTVVTWNAGKIRVRLATNLSLWWAERVAEHVVIVRSG